MQTTTPLSDLISISRQFQRSVNVASDFGSSESAKSFILNSTSLSCLETMCRFLDQTKQRAFTWTGPYGTGKSSLALFLASLLGGDDLVRQSCREKLLQNQDLLTLNFNALTSYDAPWQIFIITGHNGSLITDFCQTVGVKDTNARKGIEKFIRSAKKRPTLLLIDELGKYLEGGNSENCYFLQELAEAANRSDYPLIVVGILHQSFEAYASSLTNLQQEEWSKVQGRYVDIPLMMSPHETLQLLSRSILRNNLSVPSKISSLVDSVVDSITVPVDRKSFKRYLEGTWPINPITSLLLGPLSRRRFLQNARSVFNFLTSQEPSSFGAFLESTPIDQKTALYGLNLLWDYLRCNYEQSILSSRIDSHRWLVACDCVDRTERLSSKTLQDVVKAVAILDLFRQGSGLDANVETITASVYPLKKKEVQEALDTLTENKILIEKRYAKSYGLFEGSDFNLETAVRQVLAEHNPLDVNTLQGLLYSSPLIASRHYASSGTLRWFSTELSTLSNLESYLTSSRPKANATGRLLMCLPDMSNTIEAEEFLTILRKHQQELIFIGVPANAKDILALAQELQALNKITKDPSLEGDATARKELQSRINWISEQLRNKVSEAFNSILWFDISGKSYKIKNYFELNRMISDACDFTFNCAPTLNNELINREQLSSNITSARKRLLAAMVAHEREERLSLTGFPPEAMIYLSLLKNHLHRKDTDTGVWSFSTPDSSSSFRAIWDATELFFKQTKQPTLTDLYALWSKAPFGLKSGFMPILAMAYLLANQRNISIYLDGVFQPDINENILDRWTIDPKNISFKFIDFNSDVNELLSCLSDSMEKLSGETIEESPLAVARAMVKEVLHCPQWAMKTAQLSIESRRFRDTVLKAWDPLKLIFDELPQVFETTDTQEIVNKTISALAEIRSVTPKMLDQVRKELMLVLDSNDDYDQLANRAEIIIDEAPTIQLKAFVGRVKSLKVNRASDSAIEGFIALATSKPKTQWTDHDINQALQKIRVWGLEFRHMEGLAAMHNLSSQRRMLSIVVAGKSGRNDITLDVPARLSERISEKNSELDKLLRDLSDVEAMLLMIEKTTQLLNRIKNNG